MKRTFILILSIASCVLSVDLQAQNSDIYLSDKEDSVRQGRWRAFIKKKKAMMKVDKHYDGAYSSRLL